MAQLKIDLNSGILEVEGEESLVKEIYEDFKKQLSSLQPTKMSSDGTRKIKIQEEGSNMDLSEFQTLADCVAAIPISPLTEVQRALVAAAFLQIKGNLEKLSGQEINKELKQIGQATENITNAISGNINVKPQRMIQLRKSGTSRQAKKEYKVTPPGISAVKKLIKGEWRDEKKE
ncbi:MAG: hypothetical protein A2175_02700 [Candidatus Nealsonbacteria bacterium RBG_13_42_11]|uniref:Uncharacterized protein n=1 Tax=Candidatus Nealsonbacteria bacterium RBG_13_42_11 TaxID=1801663 RepID=A0A1G2DYM4_9BACT|nr:MAG: hypothetical protein A2175_02700 [Candidatus Nealsonbacteria bacterium RBG_13_42_11]